MDVPLHLYEPAGRTAPTSALIVFLPGAWIDAQRYAWLGRGLAASGHTVAIPDPPPHERNGGSRALVKANDLDLLARVLEFAGAYPFPLVLGGHSQGGSIVLEALCPAEAARDPYSATPPGFEVPSALIGGFTLGAHLQIGTVGLTFPWRSDDAPLARSRAVPLLLVAGQHDGLATPAQVTATAARITTPVACLTLRGANHLNWCTGTGDHDRPDLDLPASLSPAVQQEQTLGYLVRFLDALPASRSPFTQVEDRARTVGDTFSGGSAGLPQIS